MECVERVRRIAMELGYRPNIAARAVSTGRFNSISLVMSTTQWRSRLPSEVLSAIHDTLAAKDVQLNLSMLADEQFTDPGFMSRILKIKHADALLVNYTHQIPPRMRELLRDFDVPSVLMNTEGDQDCVRPDDLDGGRRATKYLLKLGHRKIAYLDYMHSSDELPTAHYSARHRCEGYLQAMKTAGLAPRVIRPETGPVPHELWRTYSREWLLADDRPTAVLTWSDRMAPSVAITAMLEGLSVPNDLSLMTFSHGRGPLDEFGLKTTQCVIPNREVGLQAAKLVLVKAYDTQDRFASREIPFEVRPGQSSAPPQAE